MTSPIFTEKRSCRDCYKCVRSCPVKAISLQDGSALVNPQWCIYCGRCVEVCPAGAKKVRSDLPRAKQIASMRKTAVSLSPSFYGEYGQRVPAILSFLKAQGINHIADTAIGAEYLNVELQKDFVSQPERSWISSACPVIVQYVSLYRPDLLDSLTPQSSPMVIHGEIIKEELGQDYRVIFIGPCIAKKYEADLHGSQIDVALTFQELEEWINQEGGLPDDIQEEDQERAATASLYPLDGGMLLSMGGASAMDGMAISGMTNILHALEDGPGKDNPVFLECLACPGGCINGPARVEKGQFIVKQSRIRNLAEQRKNLKLKDRTVTSTYLKDHGHGSALELPRFSEDEIMAALLSLDKALKDDQLNCGGCGYSTCRDFAVSFLAGKSEKEMCAGNMRKLAQKKVNALIERLPLGVVMVDQNLNIVELNGPFLEYFSEAPTDDYQEINRRTQGLGVSRFAPLEKGLLQALGGKLSWQESMEWEQAVYQLTFFSVEPKRLAGVLVQDISQPTIRRETIVRKAEDVIRKNLESVQQIASLLGENAAETEIILNSVIEAMGTPGGDSAP